VKSRHLSVAAVALLLFAGAAEAAAQGRRNSPLAAQAMHNFAICAANRSPRGAARLLAMDFRTEAYTQALRRFALGHNSCTARRTSLRFSGSLFAGGLAEQLLREPIGARPLALLVAHDPARPAIEARDETEAMGLCTVRQAPAETQALLATEPGSAQEAAAAAALTPAITACLTRGQAMRLNRPGMRALLALAAYRLVRESRPSS